MPRPRVHDEALRVRLLERAGELLSAHGPAGLGLRRLAAEAGTSTTAVYSLFGGKPGLVRELYVEGFRRLGDRMEGVSRTGDPAEDMVALGHAYRLSALANHNFYSIMFGKPVPDFEPDADAREQARRSLLPLIETVDRALVRGVFAGMTREEVVFAAWGLVHGLVSLELNGSAPPGLDRHANFDRALRHSIAGWRP